jgi:hypothetical protein
VTSPTNLGGPHCAMISLVLTEFYYKTVPKCLVIRLGVVSLVFFGAIAAETTFLLAGPDKES